jgi:hypothetical protein
MCVAENTPIPARKAIKDRKQANHSLLGTYRIKLVPGTCSLPRHPVAARVGSEIRLWDDLQSVPIRSLVHEDVPYSPSGDDRQADRFNKHDLCRAGDERVKPTVRKRRPMDPVWDR